MIKTINCLKSLICCFLILLQVSDSWCADLSPSLVKIYSGSDYLCAGTLVKDIYVLTSAECLIWQHNASALIVAGNVVKEKATVADLSRASDMFKPKDFDKHTKHMNVAVIKLAKSIVGPKIKSAELCNLESFKHGEPSTLYAWYLYEYLRKTRPGNVLRYNINVIDKDTCLKNYRIELTDTTFCGADVKRIDCIKDKGGPVAIRGQFCGIHSWGSTCIENSNPAGFTSLINPNVRQFITESFSK